VNSVSVVSGLLIAISETEITAFNAVFITGFQTV
jgi:hypothetical protein